MNFTRHPCFNADVRQQFGRIHLPVAPRCNIQCKFCNRQYDCVNESRPGVTSAVLSPPQALAYLQEALNVHSNIAVVGIAGPGDPFANPAETLTTLRLIRAEYPDMLLCLASNGLNLSPYVDELADLQVSHVTVTVNAVDPQIGAQIYAWVRSGKRVYQAREGAALLLNNQLEAIRRLKAQNVTVKVNSIILPGVNDAHIAEIARMMAELKVDILNCIPYYKTIGSAFESMDEPSQELTAKIRAAASQYLPQMQHCTRCRADAIGLLGEPLTANMAAALQWYAQTESAMVENPFVPDPQRPNVAVASMEGVLVNQHVGEAEQLWIYAPNGAAGHLLETRATPAAGAGMQRWEELAGRLSDCHTLLVSGIGENPKTVLTRHGVRVVVMEGLIQEAVSAVFTGKNLKPFTKHAKTVCGAACAGAGTGCG